MPRVVFIGHTAQPSGAELSMLRLARSLTRYEPVVVLAEYGPLVEQLRTSGVQCLVLPMDASVAHVRHHEVKLSAQTVTAAVRVRSYARDLGRLLRAQNPDVINTFSLKAHVFGRLATSTLRVSKVAHVHDRLSPEYMRRTSIALLRPILGRSDGLVFNSASTQSTVPPLRRGQVRAVLGSAIDPPSSVITPAAGTDGFTFGCVGRLTPWKGQKLALRAFASLHGSHPERNLRLKFIGGALFGEDTYQAELHELAHALRIGDRVDWTGHVNDVYAELRHVDVVVHCSTTPEPFGQVVVEGMAFGIPVIVSGEGGPAELVTAGVNGLTFTPRSVSSLAEAMERSLLMSERQRDSLTAAASVVAAAYYSDATAARTESFYDKVLTATARKRL